ncbi:MAG: Pr6Pr family membrane protein [Propionibacteriaceae bacterium]|jgi:hypothetical protein|nr:Pr6Pr family membrane protein [Propionibacteriaceae bacterium]
MRIENRLVSAVYRVVLVGVCLTGLILNFQNVHLGAAVQLLTYYTIQSNILALVFFVILLVAAARRRGRAAQDPFPSAKGAVTLAITITFLVFHFLLRPVLFSMSSDPAADQPGSAPASYAMSMANLLVHYVTPLMVLGDWLLFSPKGVWNKLAPIKWLIVPLAYFGFALIGAQLSLFPGASRYPYFFIDFDLYGAAQVWRNVLFIAIGFAALGYLMWGIDRALSKLSRHRDPAPAPGPDLAA